MQNKVLLYTGTLHPIITAPPLSLDPLVFSSVLEEVSLDFININQF